MIELIQNEIMDSGSLVTWEDIAGLEFQKKTVKEIVVLPMLRPDIFTGLKWVEKREKGGWLMVTSFFQKIIFSSLFFFYIWNSLIVLMIGKKQCKMRLILRFKP